MWSTVSDVAREFARCWAEELRAILASVFPRIGDAGGRQVLFREGDRWRLRLLDGRTVQELEASGRQSALTCDLAIPADLCLRRRLAFPAASHGKLDAMARLDLERRTPLKPDDVHSGIQVDAYDRGTRQLQISQYIVKRERIAEFRERAGETGHRIRSLVVFPDDDRAKPAVALEAEPGPSRWSRTSLIACSLAGLVLCLSLSAALIHASGQRHVLNQLDAAISKRKALAKPVLDAVQRSKAEAGKRHAIAEQVAAYRPVVVVLDEVTRLLPDDVWVGSLSFTGNRIELSGFAPSAANLVKLIEASPTFSAPSLTSPVMYDRNQGKEQFTLAFERPED